MSVIFVTLLMSHLLMSPLKEELANISNIFVTLLTSHLLMSPLKAEDKNMEDITVTLLTSHSLMSSLKLAFQNVADIFVTLLVFHLLMSPLKAAALNMPNIVGPFERFGTSEALMVRFSQPAKAKLMEVHAMSPHCSTERICPAAVVGEPNPEMLKSPS